MKLPVELVVTVPELLPRDLLVATATRSTLGVLVELAAESRTRIVLASPFLQLRSAICRGPLGVALSSAAERGVLIDVVSMSGSISKRDTAVLSTDRLPKSIRVFQPRPNFDNSNVMGSHAKVCLIDGQAAYVGSANFTNKGLSEHFELGALVRGQPARDLATVVERLFESEFFVLRGWLQLAACD